MIDLHLHTTASDGRSSPEELVSEVAAAGVEIMAVTDHDTTASIAAVTSAARARGIACVPGIEITAVWHGRDVHMLGYFLDPDHREMQSFLEGQRQDRLRRVHAIAGLLGHLGVPVDLAPRLEAARAQPGSAVGRPLLAAALVDAGHVVSMAEAFERYLGDGRPAFIERSGARPAAVIGLIARAGGVASLAHPGKGSSDSLIPALADAGLPALEVYHAEHDPIDVARYRGLAAQFNLVATGGSDYHGAGSGRTNALGKVGLPRDEFTRLLERAGRPEWPA